MCTNCVGVMTRINRWRKGVGRRSLVQVRLTESLRWPSEEGAVQTPATRVLGSLVVRINRPPGAASG